ncbi:MAG: DUF3109 family protein [Bacteroidia bacterium]
MIILGDQLISEDILEKNFICNLKVCKGACCIEGDAGAPLSGEEVELLKKDYHKISPFLNEDFKKSIEQSNFYEIDEDGEFVTTCQPTGECNFVVYDSGGMLQCGIELAWKAGVTSFQKPISCHLYPIRTIKVGDFEGLNYHRWDICKAACALGNEKEVKVYEFLKEPLIRKFGAEWYAELEAISEAYHDSMKNGNNPNN